MPKLSDSQRNQLLAETSRLVEAAASGKSTADEKLELATDLAAIPLAGVFVTLRKNGELRGCCGRLGESRPLADLLSFSARQTTLHDPRFSPVSPEELPDLTVDCSLLGPRAVVPGPAVDRVKKVEVGRHGVRISNQQTVGLLLPQVPVELGWNVQQFLEGVCRKAGLPLDAWKSDQTTLEIFEGIHFGGPLLTQPSQAAMSSTKTYPFIEHARPSAVAGHFYPADSDSRNALVENFLQTRKRLDASFLAPNATENSLAACAIMTPHAGLRYSGRVAASAWGNVEIPDSVLIIGPKHTRAGVAFAIDPHIAWELDAGTKLAADTELMTSIAENVPGMEFDSSAHEREHSIEVELPFLAYLKPQTKVCGIAMSWAPWSDLKVMAQALAEVISSQPTQPLIAISSDMNHFATDQVNRRLDAMALEALQSRDGEHLLSVCQHHQISMCGVVPAALVLTTLSYLQPNFQVHISDYATSADVSGDTSRVVGYAGAIMTTAHA